MQNDTGFYKNFKLLALGPMFLALWLAASLFFKTTLAYAQEYPSGYRYIQVPGVVHVHSNISSGIYSLKTVAKLVKEKGIKIAIITDHDTARLEYGLSPLRKIIRRVVSENSVLKYGIKNYLREIEEAGRDYPGILLVDGVEASPFYYWSGNLFRENLTINNWHKSLHVIGLKNSRDYRSLPSVITGTFRYYGGKSFYQFWPLIILLPGIYLLRRKRKIFAFTLLFLGILFLLNNFPFSQSKYDQYHGDYGIAPYQELIDYVNDRGGVTIWTSPEASYSREINGVKFVTPAYLDDLLNSYNYTGFTALYGDNISALTPGGVWDKILTQYSDGQRERPVWGIGELDYHNPSREIDSIQTVFLLSEFSREAVINALKKGRMYALIKPRDSELRLDEFSLESEGRIAVMGGELKTNSRPKITVKVYSGSQRKVKVEIIRKGELIAAFSEFSPVEIAFEDDTFNFGEKTYYRLDIRSNGGRIVSNPIFVTREDRGQKTEDSMKTAIKSIKDLKVCNLAYRFAMEIFEITKKFPKEETYSLTDQIRRSSRSVAINIREGFAKRKYENVFIKHLNDSLGSSEETRGWLDFAKDCKYITENQHKDLNKRYDEISAMIYSLMNKWQNYSDV